MYKDKKVATLRKKAISTGFSKFYYMILDRHYLKINLFGYVSRIWNTRPKKILYHLKETKYKEGCVCNEISKYQIGGFCRSCHTDWL